MSGTKGFLQRFKDTFRSSSSGSATGNVIEKTTLPAEDELGDPPIEIKRRVSRSRSGRIKQFSRSRSLICDYTFQPIGDEEFNKKSSQDGTSGGGGNSDKMIDDKEIKRIEKTWSLSAENVDTKDLQF